MAVAIAVYKATVNGNGKGKDNPDDQQQSLTVMMWPLLSLPISPAVQWQCLDTLTNHKQLRGQSDVHAEVHVLCITT